MRYANENDTVLEKYCQQHGKKNCRECEDQPVDTPSESENRVSVRAGLHVKRYARHSLHLKIAGMLDRLYWVEAE